jgi:phosphatidylglycerophosphate synthase
MKSLSLLSDAVLHCAVAGAAVVAAAAAAMSAGFGAVPVVAVPLYGCVAAFVLVLLKHHGPQLRFGPANRVTLGRAVIVSVLAGFALDADQLDDSGRVAISLAALAALLLDGVDGRLARRSGTATPFGARFDMEVDALTVLALGLLVYRTGQAGAWVLLLGAARYAFALAGWLWPVLTRELAPSWRRKAICVATVVALLVALAPVVPAGIAASLCAAAGFLLIYSFGIDCILLLRGAPSSLPVARPS